MSIDPATNKSFDCARGNAQLVRYLDNAHLKALLVFTLAIGVRLAFLEPALQGDSFRFLSQSNSISEGNGFGRYGELETDLPPGYPLLISFVFVIGSSVTTLVFLQSLMSALCCYILYCAIFPYGKSRALFAAFLLAVSPPVASMATVVHSETLGIVLSSTLVYLMSVVDRNESQKSLVLLGFTCIALALTSPFAVFLAVSAWGGAVVRYRNSLRSVVSLSLGALILMIPWQAHCWLARGKLEPMLYSESEHLQHSGILDWLRASAWSEKDMWAIMWGCYRQASPLTIDDIDSDVFVLPEEKFKIKELVHQRNRGAIEDKEFDTGFSEIARQKRIAAPISCAVVRPVVRAVRLWGDLPSFGPVREDIASEGFGLSLVQVYRSNRTKEYLLNMAMVICHYFYLSIYGIVFVSGVLSRRWLALSVVFGILAYTLFSGAIALGEGRRNIVFLPPLLFLCAFLPCRQPPGVDKSMYDGSKGYQLLLASAAIIVVSWISFQARWISIQQRCLDVIQREGGEVHIDARSSWVDRIATVKRISFDSSNIKDHHLKYLRPMFHLRSLTLSKTGINGSGLRFVRPLQLVSLDLSATSIEDSNLIHVRRLTDLEKLNLSFTDLTDAGVWRIRDNVELKILQLNSTHITDASVPILCAMENLKVLDLRETGVSETGMTQLQESLPFCEILR